MTMGIVTLLITAAIVTVLAYSFLAAQERWDALELRCQGNHEYVATWLGVEHWVPLYVSSEGVVHRDCVDVPWYVKQAVLRYDAELQALRPGRTRR